MNSGENRKFNKFEIVSIIQRLELNSIDYLFVKILLVY